MVDTSELTKLYYSIGEVAEMFDVAPSLVRYWETEFKTLKPQKSRKGDRRFTRENIEQLNLIYHLVKVKGYTLDGARREIKEYRKQEKLRSDLLRKMDSLLKGMKKMRAQLD